MSTIPDLPPVTGYTTLNSNSILDWNAGSLQQKLKKCTKGKVEIAKVLFSWLSDSQCYYQRDNNSQYRIVIVAVGVVDGAGVVSVVHPTMGIEIHMNCKRSNHYANALVNTA